MSSTSAPSGAASASARLASVEGVCRSGLCAITWARFDQNRLPGWVPRNQSSNARMVRVGRRELERRVGRPPVRAVHRLEELLGPGRDRHRPAVQLGGAQRVDPVALEVGADLTHQVEAAVVEEAPEHVQPPGDLGLGDVDLERAAAVARRLPSGQPEPTLDLEGLAGDVHRARVVADIAEVGVRVVTEHGALADRAEQGAVRDERLHTGRPQCLDHRVGRIQQRRDVVVGPAGERGHQPTRLVDPEVHTQLVLHQDRSLAAAQRDVPVEGDGAGGGVTHRDPRVAVQVSAKRLRPRGVPDRPRPATGRRADGGGVALGPERPHPPAVDAHVDRAVPERHNGEAVVIDASDPQEVRHPVSPARSSRTDRLRWGSRGCRPRTRRPHRCRTPAGRGWPAGS